MATLFRDRVLLLPGAGFERQGWQLPPRMFPSCGKPRAFLAGFLGLDRRRPGSERPGFAGRRAGPRGASPFGAGLQLPRSGRRAPKSWAAAESVAGRLAGRRGRAGAEAALPPALGGKGAAGAVGGCQASGEREVWPRPEGKAEGLRSRPAASQPRKPWREHPGGCGQKQARRSGSTCPPPR